MSALAYTLIGAIVGTVVGAVVGIAAVGIWAYRAMGEPADTITTITKEPHQ